MLEDGAESDARLDAEEAAEVAAREERRRQVEQARREARKQAPSIMAEAEALGSNWRAGSAPPSAAAGEVGIDRMQSAVQKLRREGRSRKDAYSALGRALEYKRKRALRQALDGGKEKEEEKEEEEDARAEDGEEGRGRGEAATGQRGWR
jgi:fused signal recognition particle receptor